MNKLVLVNPARTSFDVLSMSGLKVPPLGLGYVAALTPDTWKVEIIDEKFEMCDPAKIEADLVGLTSVTCNSPRAYQIASQLKERKIPTVMGGIHASMLPQEALQYVDSVVIGEAEGTWSKVIKDFEDNKLQSQYRGDHMSLENLVVPRRELFQRYPLPISTMQTARGCPMACDFCSVTTFNGGEYRPRPVREVLREMWGLESTLIIFADDNLYGHGYAAEQRTLALFDGMKESGVAKRWMSQIPLNFADNPLVVRSAKRSGCAGVFAGFESINTEALNGMGKSENIKRGVDFYKEFVKRLHDQGIFVVGSFIFGNDSDDPDVFDRTKDFLVSSGIDAFHFTILTPLPGTRDYKRLADQGRILYKNYPADWTKYDVTDVVFQPRQMSPEKLREGVYELYKEMTPYGCSLSRAIKHLFPKNHTVKV